LKVTSIWFFLLYFRLISMFLSSTKPNCSVANTVANSLLSLYLSISLCSLNARFYVTSFVLIIVWNFFPIYTNMWINIFFPINFSWTRLRLDRKTRQFLVNGDQEKVSITNAIFHLFSFSFYQNNVPFLNFTWLFNII